MDDDLVLLDRWCGGDRAAGNALFARHFQAVYRFLVRKVDGDIDDLVQETFLACLHGRERFRRQSSFRTYLFAIARNTLFGYWRRRSGARSTLDFEEVSVASLSTSAGTRLVPREDRAALLTAMRALPLEQQLLLEMSYWEDLDRDQLAEIFDIEPATVSTRLFRARDALRSALSGRAASPPSAVGDFDAWARSLRAGPNEDDDCAAAPPGA